MAPRNTPQPVLKLLSDKIVAALARPDIQERFDKLGILARGSSPDAFERFLRGETATWAPALRLAASGSFP